jgi:hypothetical protein
MLVKEKQNESQFILCGSGLTVTELLTWDCRVCETDMYNITINMYVYGTFRCCQICQTVQEDNFYVNSNFV